MACNPFCCNGLQHAWRAICGGLKDLAAKDVQPKDLRMPFRLLWFLEWKWIYFESSETGG
jgi:hypothetical protein